MRFWSFTAEARKFFLEGRTGCLESKKLFRTRKYPVVKKMVEYLTNNTKKKDPHLGQYNKNGENYSK